jgi:hypothetical protein
MQRNKELTKYPLSDLFWRKPRRSDDWVVDAGPLERRCNFGRGNDGRHYALDVGVFSMRPPKEVLDRVLENEGYSGPAGRK